MLFTGSIVGVTLICVFILRCTNGMAYYGSGHGEYRMHQRKGGYRPEAEPLADLRIPTIGTVTTTALRKFKRDIEAYYAATKKEDRELCGARILRNLRGDAARACEDVDVQKLQKDCEELFKILDRLAPEGSIQIIPRVYDALFRHTVFRCVRTETGQSSMGVYLDELEYNRKQLEKEDQKTHISDSVLGYFTMLRSGLTERERTHILGLTGSSFAYDKVAKHLRDLYPEGSQERRRTSFAPRREAYWVDEADYDDEQLWEEPEENYELEESMDQAGDEEQEMADGIQALLATEPEELSDEQIAFAAGMDEGLADALVSMREGHAKMHELKKARGFFRGTFDWAFSPTQARATPGQAEARARPAGAARAADRRRADTRDHDRRRHRRRQGPRARRREAATEEKASLGRSSERPRGV